MSHDAAIVDTILAIASSLALLPANKRLSALSEFDALVAERARAAKTVEPCYLPDSGKTKAFHANPARSVAFLRKGLEGMAKDARGRGRPEAENAFLLAIRELDGAHGKVARDPSFGIDPTLETRLLAAHRHAKTSRDLRPAPENLVEPGAKPEGRIGA